MIRASLWSALALAGFPAAVAAQTALPVEIVTVTAAPRIVELRLVGRVEAAKSYPGAFRSGGRIVEIGYDTGDRVPEGAVLARIDATQAEAVLAGAKAGLEAADASLRQAELARDRAQSLLDRGVGTRAQLDAVEEAFLAARASRDQAVAQLESARQSVEDTVIRAGEGLIVLDRLADPGEIVGAGQEVLRLASEGRMEALFLSPDASDLSELQGIPAELDSNGLAPFTTMMTEISPVLTATGTVEVRAPIPPEASAALTIGDTLEGRMRLEIDPVFTVPWTALAATRTGPAVWTVDPTTMVAHLTPVVIDSYNDASIDLSGGLADGALVVGAGSQSLYEGMMVKQAGADE